MPGNPDFFRATDYILYGLSPKRVTIARAIKEGLEGMGWRVYPVNPKAKGDGYYELSSMVGKANCAIVALNKQNAVTVLDDLKKHSIKQVWLQNGSYDKQILNRFKEAGFDTYTGCVMMYLPNSAFFHKLHRFLHDLVSKDK
jgi:predicted CoA-binding protein